MTHPRSFLSQLALAAAVAAGALAAAGQAPAPGHGKTMPTLNAIKQEIAELHKLSSSCLIRVDVQQSSAGMLTPALREEFDRWIKNNQENSRGNRDGQNRDQGRDQGRDDRNRGGRGGPRPDAMGGPPFGPRGGGPGGPAGLHWNMVRAFLSEQADKAEKAGKTDEAASLRGMAVNVSLYRNGFQGELSAVLLSADGIALLPAGLLRVAHHENNTISATLPDGSKTLGRFVGTNLISGYTIVQLDKAAGLKPAALARDNITPGDLLLFITAAQGQSGLLVAPGKPGAVAVDRLAVPSDERSGTFLFDVGGDLAAFVSAGNWSGGRQAFSSERLKREINYILRTRKDVEQRPLGVSFKPLSPEAAKKLETPLAGRRAVLVTDILPNTLAANSSLKSDDILLAIDGRPISDFIAPDGRMPLPELILLQADLATRTGQLPLTILRGEKEETLQVPLD